MKLFGRTTAKEDKSKKQIFHEYTQPLMSLGLFGFILVTALVLYEFFSNESPVLFYLRLTLLMIAGGAFVLGLVVGFILAPYADEKQTFGPIAGLINGVIGGFAVSDISKPDSAIIRGLHSLSSAAGVSGVGLVGCIVVFFGVIGFLCGYINKQYVLNPSLSQAKQLEDLQTQITEITKNININLADVESSPDISDADKKALQDAVEPFTKVMQNDKLFRELCLDTIKAYAKGFLLLQKFAECEAVLRKARYLAPDDPDLMLQLAKLLCRSRRPLKAIPYLSLLQEINSDVSVYKLLGYALLFVPTRLEEAKAASELYLRAHPEDFGAKINLACVYGQSGPQDPNNVTQALSLLRQAVKEGGEEAKRAIVKLPSDDFSAWNNLPAFVEFISQSQPTVKPGDKPSPEAPK
jgi:tetratricopeptide (TPR) repeat protein